MSANHVHIIPKLIIKFLNKRKKDAKTICKIAKQKDMQLVYQHNEPTSLRTFTLSGKCTYRNKLGITRLFMSNFVILSACDFQREKLCKTKNAIYFT